MVGKNPHRPEGKTKADDEHAPAPWQGHARAGKAPHERDLENMERNGGPTRAPAEEPIGGSRPGVPSRVREAIERRDGA